MSAVTNDDSVDRGRMFPVINDNSDYTGRFPVIKDNSDDRYISSHK